MSLWILALPGQKLTAVESMVSTRVLGGKTGGPSVVMLVREGARGETKGLPLSGLDWTTQRSQVRALSDELLPRTVPSSVNKGTIG